MRMFPSSVLVLVSLATIATGQFVGSRVAAPPADAPNIEPSKVKFLLVRCSIVYGIVARELDLREDLTVRRLLQMGTTFAQEKCPSQQVSTVYLRPGDPATFTDVTKFLERPNTLPEDGVMGNTHNRDQLGWDVWNSPKRLKDEQIAREAQARQRDALLEQQTQARNNSDWFHTFSLTSYR